MGKRTKVWRTIFLDDISQLDINNFGIHWTSDINFTNNTCFINENISNHSRQGNIAFIFEAEITKKCIDFNNTEKSNSEYPIESECVLKENLVLTNVNLINQIDTVTYDIVCTGSRKDSWLE